MERRHRINESEMKWIVRAVFYRLLGLSYKFESEGINEETTVLFKFLWRVTRHSKGKPGYPIINADTINEFIRENGESLLST
jgi:hypothetical protein